MGKAERAARLTVLQGGFVPGQRVVLKNLARTAGELCAPQEQGGLPPGWPPGKAATLQNWLEEEELWEVVVDGGATLTTQAGVLRLEARAEEEPALENGDVPWSDHPAGGPKAWRGRQIAGDLVPGDLIEVFHRGSWVDAVVAWEGDSIAGHGAAKDVSGSSAGSGVASEGTGKAAAAAGRRGSTAVGSRSGIAADARAKSVRCATGDGGCLRVVTLAGCCELAVGMSRIRRKEGYQPHRRRMQACEMAEAKLQTGRKIADDDVLEVLRVWSFSENALRKNVIPEGENWVYSDTFGLIRSRSTGGCVESYLTKRYPQVMRLVSQWAQDRGPKRVINGKSMPFPFTSVNLNFGYAAKLHRDRYNGGPSLIRALGQFEGGRLCYFRDDDRSVPVDCLPLNRIEKIDTRRAFWIFDGRRGHSVEEFQGERFSVVFYTCRSYREVGPELRRHLTKRCGAHWPTQATITAFSRHIPVARGYPDVTAPPKKRQRDGASSEEDEEAEEEDETPEQEEDALDHAHGGGAAARRRLRAKTASLGGGRGGDGCDAENPAPAADGTGEGARVAAARKYRLVQFPHLALGLKLHGIYTQGALVKKCKGDLQKLTAMRRKLADPLTFEPIDE